jgi:hypothetical protein
MSLAVRGELVARRREELLLPFLDYILLKNRIEHQLVNYTRKAFAHNEERSAAVSNVLRRVGAGNARLEKAANSKYEANTPKRCLVKNSLLGGREAHRTENGGKLKA